MTAPRRSPNPLRFVTAAFLKSGDGTSLQVTRFGIPRHVEARAEPTRERRVLIIKVGAVYTMFWSIVRRNYTHRRGRSITLQATGSIANPAYAASAMSKNIVPILLGIALTGIASPSYGQNADAYLPVAEGNHWTYFDTQDPPTGPPDTVWKATYEMLPGLVVNDTSYVAFDHPFTLAEMIRMDSSGRVWARVDDRDVLYFDFGLPDSVTYTFPFEPGSPESDTLHYTVGSSTLATCESEVGTFADCRQLTFHIQQVSDSDVTYVFAPGAGILRANGFFGQSMKLLSANVDGTTITNVLLPDAPDAGFSISAGYPNPFRETLSVDVRVARAQFIEARVYDTGGRLVDTIIAQSLPSGMHTIVWDPQRVAAGHYTIVVSGAHDARTLQVAYAR